MATANNQSAQKISLAEIIVLLDSELVRSTDLAIADKSGFKLAEDLRRRLAAARHSDVSSSKLSVAEIQAFIQSRLNLLVEFGAKFLASGYEEDITDNENDGLPDSSPRGSLREFAAGFTITYAIYLHFLLAQRDRELADFLLRRKVVNAPVVLQRMKRILKQILQDFGTAS